MNGVEVVASWLTPTVLFCVLSLMIGAIFFRSILKPPSPLRHNKEEQPPPSLFERVKSFNLSIHHPFSQPDPVHHAYVVPAQKIRHHEAAMARHEASSGRHLLRPADTVDKDKAASDARKLEKAANDKVSAFINRFRQQLKLQRLDSAS